MTQLSGKVALVTGASSGLGATVAQLFAERGASVFGIARDTERMAGVFESVPGGVYAAVDITTPQACRDAVAQCVQRFGRLDVLVNAAGFHQMRHTTSVADEAWDYDLAVNLNGPFYLCRAALPHLLEVGGNIVNVVCPGGMLTPQVTDFTAPDNADYNLIMRIAAPRGMMDPPDVAKAIAFLASDDAAAIHGAVYPVDNGKTAG